MDGEYDSDEAEAENDIGSKLYNENEYEEAFDHYTQVIYLTVLLLNNKTQAHLLTYVYVLTLLQQGYSSRSTSSHLPWKSRCRCIEG